MRIVEDLKSCIRKNENQWRFWCFKKYIFRLGVGDLMLVFVQEKTLYAALVKAEFIYGIISLHRQDAAHA